MREKIAKTKWCPMARVHTYNDGGSYNRLKEDGGAIGACLGSGCMAWRSIDDFGWCGLAGTPPAAERLMEDDFDGDEVSF